MADESVTLLNIGGDACNKVLPFKLPDGNLFTFRPSANKFQKLNICPSSLQNAVTGGFQNDVSMNAHTGATGNDKFHEILNNIPTVQIREYAQDARIVQIQNIFSHFKAGWDAFRDVSKNQGILDAIKQFLRNLPGKIEENLGKLTGDVKAINQDINVDGLSKNAVLDIPFILYYQLLSTKTNGYYILPYSGKIVDMSNGSVGWNTQHGFNGVNTSTNTIVGTLMNFLGKNIKFNTTPTWDGNTQNDFSSIEVQVDLFNDTIESALNNFIFINSIIPKNKFLQYHIFQQNPCVYDIKIEGYNRFYMCSANLQCEYKGVSRTPSDEFFKTLEGRVSDGFKKFLTVDTLKNNKLVRIPDVYQLKISFTSLLPNSINNYLYNYTGNVNMEMGVWGNEGLKDQGGDVTRKIGEAHTAAMPDKLKSFVSSGQSTGATENHNVQIEG